MKNITETIECVITDFLDYTHDLSYPELIAMEKMLEAEQYRIVELRSLYNTEMSRYTRKLLHTKLVRAKITEYEKSYISTFVLEQKVSDRLCLIRRLKKSKGVDLSIFHS